MRMMLRFTFPVEKSNAAINDGSLVRTMESILSKLEPEAAYFAPLERHWKAVNMDRFTET